MTEKSIKQLVVCVNERLGIGQKSCGSSGSRKLIDELKSQLSQRNIPYDVKEQVCLARCEQGIAMRIAPGGPFFTEVTRHDIPRIIRALQQFNPAE